MGSLLADDLTIEVGLAQPGVILLDWRGKSNARQPGTILAPFLADVAKHAVTTKRSIEMRFEHLEHFNSSTITSLIQLIQDLRNKGVKLTIVFEQGLKWQRLSFDALRIFEKPDGLLTFRTTGA